MIVSSHHFLGRRREDYFLKAKQNKNSGFVSGGLNHYHILVRLSFSNPNLLFPCLYYYAPSIPTHLVPQSLHPIYLPFTSTWAVGRAWAVGQIDVLTPKLRHSLGHLSINLEEFILHLERVQNMPPKNMPLVCELFWDEGNEDSAELGKALYLHLTGFKK